jgi:hypothetical protein
MMVRRITSKLRSRKDLSERKDFQSSDVDRPITPAADAALRPTLHFLHTYITVPISP